MKFIKHLLILILPLYSNAVAQQKAVFIILDGIPADVLENTPTPVMDEISRAGGYTRGFLGGDKNSYSESPTVSAVGYNHLLTGVWSNKHNVFDNDIAHPNYNYWNIFRIVETANPTLKTAIFSTWTDNRTKLIGEKLPSAGNIQLDYAFDGFENDTIKFPRDKERLFIFKIDEKVSTEAGRYIQAEGPDLSWVYLEYTDDMGHLYGDGPQMTDAVKKADIQVGRIWEGIKEREKKFNEEWMILVTTDHGRDELTGKDHGGQSERERTIWMLTNVKNTNHRFRDMPATVDILPSILRFMKVDGPESVMMELDGVPFIGPVSIANMNAIRQNDKIEITWDVLDPSGQVTIQLATTNNFKEGKPDIYKTIGETPASTGHYTIDISKMKSPFYKILLKARYNTTNRWIVNEVAR
jgi:hypothetical protein